MSRLWSAIQAHYRPSVGLPRLGRADRGDEAHCAAPCRCSRAATRAVNGGEEPGVFVHPDLLPPCRRCSASCPRPSRSSAAPSARPCASRARTSTAPQSRRTFAHAAARRPDRDARSASTTTREFIDVTLPPGRRGRGRLAGRSLDRARRSRADGRRRAARDQRRRDAPRSRAGARPGADGRRATPSPAAVTVDLAVSATGAAEPASDARSRRRHRAGRAAPDGHRHARSSGSAWCPDGDRSGCGSRRRRRERLVARSTTPPTHRSTRRRG